jgi:hypothetical protein
MWEVVKVPVPRNSETQNDLPEKGRKDMSKHSDLFENASKRAVKWVRVP